MKNIEYYQKEIREKYNYKLRYSANNVWKYDLADALFEVWDEHTDGNADVMTWLYEEHKEPILDEVEREYLSDVIKPFRDKVIYINKLSRYIRDGEYAELIVIYTKQYLGYQYIYLPDFKGGTMYKGMELRKKYTLKELEL